MQESIELHDTFDHLTPDLVINAVESLGYLSDARIFPLNSYENRVYQVGIEEQNPIVVKFYRPLRWTDEQILEEHQFSQMLTDLELPVIAPMPSPEERKTLSCFAGYRFAAFRRQGGQAPEPGDFDQLHWLGRLMGRFHQAARAEPFKHRPGIDIETYCDQPYQLLLTNQFIPSHFETDFNRVIEELRTLIIQYFKDTQPLSLIRTHGDCHIGNILWNRDTGPWFVDFDDCRMAPAIQDLWMLLAGDRPSRTAQFAELLEGYQEFSEFNYAEIKLIEALRALRMIHYAGWLAKRWDYPAFPINFPWFNTPNYWQQTLSELQEQVILLNEEPLTLF